MFKPIKKFKLGRKKEKEIHLMNILLTHLVFPFDERFLSVVVLEILEKKKMAVYSLYTISLNIFNTELNHFKCQT